MRRLGLNGQNIKNSKLKRKMCTQGIKSQIFTVVTDAFRADDNMREINNRRLQFIIFVQV